VPVTPFDILKKAVESDPPEQVYSLTRNTMRDFFAAFEQLEQAFIAQTFFSRDLRDRADIYQRALNDILECLCQGNAAVGPSDPTVCQIATEALNRVDTKRKAN
jgi:hypothetical protein